jgi:hypothetical protein
MLLVRPLSGMGEYLFGWQSEKIINGAILNLPQDSDRLNKLIALSRLRIVIGPHWSFKHKTFQKTMSLIGKEMPIERLDWGVIGPSAITYYVTACGLLHHSQSVDVLYPVLPNDAARFFRVNTDAIKTRITSNTRAIHLWNELIKEQKNSSPRGLIHRKNVHPVRGRISLAKHVKTLPLCSSAQAPSYPARSLHAAKVHER